MKHHISYTDPILLALCSGYAMYSAIRKTLSVALPLLLTDLSLTKSHIGIVPSYFAFAYGLSKFFSSVLSDYVDCRIMFSTGLFLTSLMTMLFGLGSSVEYFCIIWFLNGCVQGVGWPALAAIVFENYDSSTRGTVWSTATASGNVGYILGPFAYASLLYFGWRAPFFCAGCVGIILSVFCYILIPNKTVPIIASEHGQLPAVHSSGWKWALSVSLWLLFLSSACTMFMLRGLSDWSGLYLVESCGWSNGLVTFLVFWSEAGGMVGSALSGIISDAPMFKGRRDITSFFFSAVLLPVFVVLPAIIETTCLQKIDHPDYTVGHMASGFSYTHASLAVVMFLAGVGINAPKTLIGMCVREAVPGDRVGLAGGMLGVIGQAGGIAAGAGIGWVLQNYGWKAFTPLLLTAATLCSGCILGYVVLFSFFETRGQNRKES